MNIKTFLTKGLVPGLAVAVFVSACDFEVVNPGPVQDQTLDEVAAHQGMVNGAQRSTQSGLGNYGYTGGVVVGETTASGHTGSSGTQVQEEAAQLDDQWSGRGSFGQLHNGRWIAEEALRRFESNVETTVSTYPLAAEAHFWAGIASRTLGENACTAVFDGGPTQPRLDYFTDPEHGAIYHFNMAETIGLASGQADLAMAAVGARAAANLHAGNIAAAQADAQAVTAGFEYATEYSGFGSEFWYTAGAVASLAFQSISLWGTEAHSHFLDTGDTRVAWGYDNGSLEVKSGDDYAKRAQTHPARTTWTALIPMYYPLKTYMPRSSTPDANGIYRELRIFESDLTPQRELNFNLVDAREMALIDAVAELLLNGAAGVTAAMALINSVRTATPVYPANLATAMDLTYHPEEAEVNPFGGPDNNPIPVYYNLTTKTPGDFSGGGMMSAVTATTLAEARAALKFERYLELHLEGRRFGDRWRWRAAGEPDSDLRNLEFIADHLVTKYSVPRVQSNLCFPLPRQENDANDNIDPSFMDWVVG